MHDARVPKHTDVDCVVRDEATSERGHCSHGAREPNNSTFMGFGRAKVGTDTQANDFARLTDDRERFNGSLLGRPK